MDHVETHRVSIFHYHHLRHGCDGVKGIRDKWEQAFPPSTASSHSSAWRALLASCSNRPWTWTTASPAYSISNDLSSQMSIGESMESLVFNKREVSFPTNNCFLLIISTMSRLISSGREKKWENIVCIRYSCVFLSTLHRVFKHAFNVLKTWEKGAPGCSVSAKSCWYLNFSSLHDIFANVLSCFQINFFLIFITNLFID